MPDSERERSFFAFSNADAEGLGTAFSPPPTLFIEIFTVTLKRPKILKMPILHARQETNVTLSYQIDQ
jgi:hypothetical protein